MTFQDKASEYYNGEETFVLKKPMLQKLMSEVQSMKEKDMQRMLGQKDQIEAIYYSQGEV